MSTKSLPNIPVDLFFSDLPIDLFHLKFGLAYQDCNGCAAYTRRLGGRWNPAPENAIAFKSIRARVLPKEYHLRRVAYGIDFARFRLTTLQLTSSLTVASNGVFEQMEGFWRGVLSPLAPCCNPPALALDPNDDGEPHWDPKFRTLLKLKIRRVGCQGAPARGVLVRRERAL